MCDSSNGQGLFFTIEPCLKHINELYKTGFAIAKVSAPDLNSALYSNRTRTSQAFRFLSFEVHLIPREKCLKFYRPQSVIFPPFILVYHCVVL